MYFSGPLYGKKNFIDAGHGGTYQEGIERCTQYNVGTSGKLSGYEKDSVLNLAEELRLKLYNDGASVMMSRFTDDPKCLSERTEMANDWVHIPIWRSHYSGEW